MPTIRYEWNDGETDRSFEMVHVEGTRGTPYGFGEDEEVRLIEVQDFWIAATPVTQALCRLVLGQESPAGTRGPLLPMENLSWDEIAGPGGFLQRLNDSPIRNQMSAAASLPDGIFRLPSETEWEYAARGGPYWRDQFRFSGSDDIDRVAWYDRRFGDHTHEVGQKMPNQLGLFDISGNVWEWCQDSFTEDLTNIPADGAPYRDDSSERIVRGGCFHSWAIHCTVSKRYQINSDYRDGCMGFRLVLAKK